MRDFAYENIVHKRGVETVMKKLGIILLLVAIWLLAVFLMLAFGQVPISENADVLDLGDGRKQMRIFTAPKYYRYYDGVTLGEVNPNVFTRMIPTDSGYTRGVWTAENMVEFPDSINDKKPLRIRDRRGNWMDIRVVGFGRRLTDGTIDIPNIVKFAGLVDSVLISGNTLTYFWGTGSTLRIIYDGRSLKQELTISEIDRRKAIKLVPTASHIGIIYEYATSGERYNIAVDAGEAWTPDGTTYPVYDLTKTYGGKNYWLAGVTWNAFRDTLGHPGAFVIDPTIIMSLTSGDDVVIRKDAPTSNYGSGANYFMATITGSVGARILLNFGVSDSIATNYVATAFQCSLYQESAASSGGGNVDNWNVAFGRLTKPYTENQATYRIRKTDSTWTNNNSKFDVSTTDSAVIDIDWGAHGAGAGWHVFTESSPGGQKFLQQINYMITHPESDFGFHMRWDSAGYDSSRSAAYHYTTFTSSEGAAAQVPRLYITYQEGLVYPADSLAFSNITDSSAVLDSIAGNPLDVSTTNKFAIYDTSKGVYLDTTQTAPYKTTKTTYVKSAWQNKRYPLTRDYMTRFKVLSYAANGTDSLKIATYDKTIGTPAVSTTTGNLGRWNPEIDKIE